MNMQRWITLGMAGLLFVCAATSEIWTAPFRDDDEDEATETPDGTALAETQEVLSTAENELLPTDEVTPTLNPILAEMMESMGEESSAVSNIPFVVLAGNFTTIDALHQGEGIASIYQVGESRYVLRLDPLNVTNGPDLHVLLSTHEAPRSSIDAVTGSLDLGRLNGNTVPQNFEIPQGTSVQIYKSVVIYSLSLNLVYTTAKLEAVRGQ